MLFNPFRCLLVFPFIKLSYLLFEFVWKTSGFTNLIFCFVRSHPANKYDYFFFVSKPVTKSDS